MSSETVSTISELKIDCKDANNEKGILLGKDEFAHCYELVDTDTKAVYALARLSPSHCWSNHTKMMEIEIHCSLSHAHIVAI